MSRARRTPSTHPPLRAPRSPTAPALVGLAAGVPLRTRLIVEGHIAPTTSDTPTLPVACAGLSAGPLPTQEPTP